MTIQKNHESDTVLETLENAATGDDEPMGDAHPGAPALLVMGAYPLILIVLLCIAALYFGYRQINRYEKPSEPGVATSQP
jgi:hypothetical protein